MYKELQKNIISIHVFYMYGIVNLYYEAVDWFISWNRNCRNWLKNDSINKFTHKKSLE